MIAGEREKIKLTISALVADFVYSVSANARNGGLIGLAATSISLAGVGFRSNIYIYIFLGSKGSEIYMAIVKLIPYVPIHALLIASVTVSGDNCATGPLMFCGPRLARAVLCVREYVQHCQSRQRKHPAVL